MVNETKQLQDAVAAFVTDVSAALADVIGRLPDGDVRHVQTDVATEALNLVSALVDVDGSHTDAELWGVIMAFGRWFPSQLMRSKPDDLRRNGMVAGRSSWLDAL